MIPKTGNVLISIHAPRMGSDRAAPRPDHTSMNFNPRSPDGERPFAGVTDGPACIFQSTLPGWGATTASTTAWTGTSRFQSTLPGWGATGQPHRTHRYGAISIHAPRMGSDLFVRFAQPPPGYFNPRSPDGERQAPPTRPTRKHQHFNPRSPDGERQCLVYGEFANHEISIHAPRMGSDSGSSKADSGSRHFNPRSPDGERLVFGASARTAVIFQSTLPGWGATSKFCMSVWFCEISIHAPRMGSDRCGRLRTLREPRISIHAPRMGSDHLTGVSGRTTADFNPRSPDGERPRKWTSSPTIWAKSSIFNTDCIADRR